MRLGPCFSLLENALCLGVVCHSLLLSHFPLLDYKDNINKKQTGKRRRFQFYTSKIRNNSSNKTLWDNNTWRHRRYDWGTISQIQWRNSCIVAPRSGKGLDSHAWNWAENSWTCSEDSQVDRCELPPLGTFVCMQSSFTRKYTFLPCPALYLPN